MPTPPSPFKLFSLKKNIPCTAQFFFLRRTFFVKNKHLKFNSRDLRFVNPLHGEYGGWTPESVQDEIGFDSADSADFLEARVGFEEIETVL